MSTLPANVPLTAKVPSPKPYSRKARKGAKITKKKPILIFLRDLRAFVIFAQFRVFSVCLRGLRVSALHLSLWRGRPRLHSPYRRAYRVAFNPQPSSALPSSPGATGRGTPRPVLSSRQTTTFSRRTHDPRAHPSLPPPCSLLLHPRPRRR